VGGDLLATTLDPNLSEEKSFTLSIAPEWQINDHWRIEVNGFNTILDDTFVDVPNDDPTTTDVKEFLKRNGSGSHIYGAEIHLGYQKENWRMELSWTEQRTQFDETQSILGVAGDPIDNLIVSDRYPRTPNSLGLLKFFHEGQWFDSFVALKLTGPMDVPEIVTDATGALIGNRLNRSPWFFNMDVGISKEFVVAKQNLTASIGVKNILNEFQEDISLGAYRDASYVYGPAFPRTVHAGLKWTF
jgi:outer membrane receptor for ferrienterochelin and colicins